MENIGNAAAALTRRGGYLSEAFALLDILYTPVK